MNTFNPAAAAKPLAAAHFVKPLSPWGTYCRDLTFEAVALWHEISQDFSDEMHLLDAVACGRGYPERLEFMPPFTWLPFRWAHARHLSEAIAKPYLQYAKQLAESVSRSAEGCILHPRGEERGGGNGMLIDVLQSYAAVQAHAGWLSNDQLFFEEAVEQYLLYRGILRDRKSGLWSQGRGWQDDPEQLSPGAWSRGHGWLMRGLVECLFHMPEGSTYYSTMAGILKEMAEDLCPLLDAEGLWHAMLHLRHERSPVETSGSALIIYAVACGIVMGILPHEEWESNVRQTVRALETRITPEGSVRDTCKGPGPLGDSNVPDYCDCASFPAGDPHGPGCFLYALSGLYLLDHPEAVTALMAK